MTQDDREICRLLKNALPPVPPGGPARDLGPRLLRRLDSRPQRITRWEWAAALGAAAWLAMFPETIWGLLVCL